ncbi:MAG: PAS domain S-box protein [Smithellaceae bacterium]
MKKFSEMKDEAKTKSELIRELHELRRQMVRLNSPEDTLAQKNKSLERLMKSFLQNSVPACLTTPKEGRFVDVSEAFLKLIGYKREEIIGKTSAELGWFTKERRSTFFMGLSKKARIENLELQIRSIKGKLIHVLFNTVSMNFNREKYFLNVITDITERKQMEEALRKSKSDLAEAQRIAKIGSWKFDVATNTVQWSEELYKIFDVDRKKFGGLYESFLQRVHPDDRMKALETNQKAIEKGESFNLSYRIVTGDNQIKHIQEIGYTMKDDNGNITGLFGTAQDITDQKKYEEKLQESEHIQRSILMAAPIGIGLVKNEIIKRVNRRMCEMTGYVSEELIDKNARMLFLTDEEFDYVEKRKYNQIYHQGIGNAKTRWMCKDGHTIDVLLSSALLDPYNLEGEVTFMAMDITDHSRAEKELKKAHDELERRVQERTAELANVIEVLRKNEQLLEAESHRLQETNIALKILLEHRKEDQHNLDRKVMANVRKLVLPYVEKLNSTPLTSIQTAYVDVIANNLDNIISPFLRNLTTAYMDLTPREIDVANLVRDGKSAKEIALLLNSSIRSIEFHKNNIRRKLGLTNTTKNLRTYLLTLDNISSPSTT